MGDSIKNPADAENKTSIVIPVIDLRGVLGTVGSDESANEALEIPNDQEASAEDARDALKNNGTQSVSWLFPFFLGVLAGACLFYAAVWALALI